MAPETPGSIHEGGELGYALVHAYGAVFDSPDLIALCVIGDGEASRVGGIQDQIIDGENGVLVDPFDLEAFGAALRDLLGDRNRAEELGGRAREHVRDAFLSPRTLAQYVELFGRLLEPGLPAR